MSHYKCIIVLMFCAILSRVCSQIYVHEIKLANSDSNDSSINTPLLQSNSTPVPTTTPVATNKSSTTKPTIAPKSRLTSARETLICPAVNMSVPLFTLPCERDNDCALLGPGLLCCERKDVRFKRCLKGQPAPKPELQHSPWLRVFPRKCPENPIAEFSAIKQCTTDADCGTRICCPEAGTSESYCRTAALHLDNFPTVKRIMEPVTTLMGYLQCSPAPPPVLDLFPKACASALDCFPDLCCQERGRRVCRPPRQSFLSFLVGFTRRVASSSVAGVNGVTNTLRNTVTNG